MAVPKVEPEVLDALAREIEKVGQGDLVLDHPRLVCVRGARADAPAIERDAVPGFPAFEIGQLPFKTVVTTREGRQFAVIVLSADKEDCELTYSEIAPADDPASAMKAFADAVTEGRYENAVAKLSPAWPELWGTVLGQHIQYLGVYGLLWRAARSSAPSEDDIGGLNNFPENYLREYLSSQFGVRVQGDRAAIVTEGWDWLLLRTEAGWKIVFGLYEDGGGGQERVSARAGDS